MGVAFIVSKYPDRSASIQQSMNLHDGVLGVLSPSIGVLLGGQQVDLENRLQQEHSRRLTNPFKWVFRPLPLSPGSRKGHGLLEMMSPDF